jgi:hypothetical protein
MLANKITEIIALSDDTILQLRQIANFYRREQRPDKEFPLSEVIEFLAHEEYKRLVYNQFIQKDKRIKKR